VWDFFRDDLWGCLQYVGGFFSGVAAAFAITMALAVTFGRSEEDAMGFGFCLFPVLALAMGTGALFAVARLRR
jgi:hypothetical protein